MLQQGNWHDWWPIIYQAVELNAGDPDQYPLHKNFWGYTRMFGRHLNKPFPERILRAGPNPQLKEVEAAIGFAKANLEGWLQRRVCYIRGIKPHAH